MSGLVALRVVVAICLVALAAAVLSFLHEQYADRSVDGILGGLMVVYCVVGILVRRQPTARRQRPAVAALTRARTPPERSGAGTTGNEPGQLGVGSVGETVPTHEGCRRWAWTGCSGWP